LAVRGRPTRLSISRACVPTSNARLTTRCRSQTALETSLTWSLSLARKAQDVLTLPNYLLCNDNDLFKKDIIRVSAVYNRISVFRAEQSMSRRQLAEAVGVNSQTIGYLERGDYKPSLELALKIARHFGVAVEMLFSFDRFEPIAMTLKRAGGSE
jgi:putative transcriptional regulator